ncbi:MAG: hypothetical protein ABFE07_03895 [Armatimonadia bacterium]
MVRTRGWITDAWDLVGEDLPAFSIAAFITISLSALSLFILALPLAAGLCIMFSEKMQGNKPTVSHLWEGVTARFPASITVWIIYLVASLPAYTLSSYLQYIHRSWWAVAMLALSSMIIWTPLFFVMQLIADRDLSAREAMKLSWLRVRPHLGGIFACVVVYSIVMVFGLFACGFGLIITLPLVTGAGMLAYRDLIGDYAVPQMIPIKEPELDEQSGLHEGDEDEEG